MATYTDVDSTLSLNGLTRDLAVLVDVNAIISSCKNLIKTDKYERPFKEYIDGGVRASLFDLLSPLTASIITDKIKSVIKRHEPRVDTIKVKVVVNNAENGYDVTITFTPKNDLTPVSFEVFLERQI